MEIGRAVNFSQSSASRKAKRKRSNGDGERQIVSREAVRQALLGNGPAESGDGVGRGFAKDGSGGGPFGFVCVQPLSASKDGLRQYGEDCDGRLEYCSMFLECIFFLLR